MPTGRAGKRRLPAGLLLLTAFVLHNLEEAVAYRAMHAEIRAALTAQGVPWWSPTPDQFSMVLALLTLAVANLIIWAVQGEATHGKLQTLRILAAILLINIAVPHVPAAQLLGGYAPGLLTALAINLPVGLVVLQMLRRERRPR
jgi:hypothetical protein